MHPILVKTQNLAGQNLQPGPGRGKGSEAYPAGVRRDSLEASRTSRTSAAPMAEKQQVSDATTHTSRTMPRSLPMESGRFPGFPG
jgi:hypothetical protein